MTADYVELPGSHRDAPKVAPAIASVRAVNPSEEIEVRVYLKDLAPDPLLKQAPISATQAAASTQSTPAYESLNAQRVQKYKVDIDAISKFCTAGGFRL